MNEKVSREDTKIHKFPQKKKKKKNKKEPNPIKVNCRT